MARLLNAFRAMTMPRLAERRHAYISFLFMRKYFSTRFFDKHRHSSVSRRRPGQAAAAITLTDNTTDDDASRADDFRRAGRRAR